MLIGAGIVLAIILLWVAAQLFGGRFSRFSCSGAAGCITVILALLLLLAIYVSGMAISN
jgi:hypothetical protein